MATTKTYKSQSGVVVLLLIFLIVFAGLVYLVYHAYTVRQAAHTLNNAAVNAINQ